MICVLTTSAFRDRALQHPGRAHGTTPSSASAQRPPRTGADLRRSRCLVAKRYSLDPPLRKHNIKKTRVELWPGGPKKFLVLVFPLQNLTFSHKSG